MSKNGTGAGRSGVVVWLHALIGALALSLVTAGGLRADPAELPLLHSIDIDAQSAVASETRLLRYAAWSPNGLTRMTAFYTAQNGAGMMLTAPNPSWGQLSFTITGGHLDGMYSLQTVYLSDGEEPANWASYERDGSLHTSEGSASHSVNFAAADFRIVGNGTQDRIAPRLTAINRDGTASYRYEAVDDGYGVVSVAINLRLPDGSTRAATTRAPGNTGFAALQLMQGAPVGRYTAESVVLRDGASPANVTTYHRDGRVTSTDPSVPAAHAMDFGALDFNFGGTVRPAPRLLAIELEEEAVFAYRAVAAPALVAADVLLQAPDGSQRLARAEGPGNTGLSFMSLLGDVPLGAYRVLSVRLRDGATPEGFAEYRSDGVLLATDLDRPGRHDFDLSALEFSWWGGPVPSRSELTGAEGVLLGEPVRLVARAQSVHGTPGGWVHLFRGAETLGAGELDATGRANFVLRDLAPGRYLLRARYTGSPEYRGALSELFAVTVMETDPDLLDFVGGGAVFGQSETCVRAMPTGVQPVVVRFAPSELGGPASEVAITWGEGTEHLTLWGPMGQSADFQRGAGRSIWTRFVFSEPRPMMRVVQRLIVGPPQAEIEQADEILLRLRVQNFASVQGCVAVVAATLRRGI